MLKLILLLILSFNLTVKADEVKLDKCVDGDTAWFIKDDVKIKARFLAIDTPESTNTKEPFGLEAKEFTCNKLQNAKKITIEYDPNSDMLDKYDRHLVWVFVDDVLLQDLIIKEGLAEVKYIYGDYKYTDILNNSLETAKKNKVGMWMSSSNYTYLIVIIILILCLFSTKIRKKVINKTKKNIKKKILGN